MKQKFTYEETHKEINGELYKMCTICNEWHPCTKEHFYPKKTKLSPYCKECEKKKNYKWQDENRERYNTYFKDNHSPKMRAYYRELSRARQSDGRTQAWKDKNRDKLKGYNEKYAHKAHKISKKEWLACKEYFDNKCAYCGLPIDKHYIRFKGEFKLGDFHKEHVVHTGEGDLSNCVPSCKICNSSKHTESLEVWYTTDKEFFSQERLDKIYKWIIEDYKLYIKQNPIQT